MAVKYKPGEKVLIGKPIEGIVLDNTIIDGEVHALVGWIGDGGEKHQRAFHEDLLRPVAATDTPTPKK